MAKIKLTKSAVDAAQPQAQAVELRDTLVPGFLCKIATVFPEFIARDGQERADGGRQGNKRRVGAARRRSRGHGPARLDGTRLRATVANKVMKSGETAGHGNGRLDVQTARKRSAQARSWKPGRRRQRCARLANASPGRDERIANLEQRDPRSGDARGVRLFSTLDMCDLHSMAGEEMKMMHVSELRAGDVLLCYKDAKIDPIGKGITRATDSEYTHVAICIFPNIAAEATVLGGVSKIKIEDLIKRYDHVAVFRQPDAWQPPERVQAMNAFIDSIVASGAKYNLRDVVTFKKRSEVHQLSLTDQLHAYFNGTYAPAPIEKGSYFCSELVASCFVVTGFVDPSAAVVYKSNVTSPGALGRDATFGTFCGYVSSVPNYSVPATDEFFNHSTFDEIFGDGA